MTRNIGISCHIGGWQGADAEAADWWVAPWVTHTHFTLQVVETCLQEKMANLRQAGYQGYYSVEHSGEKNEYTELGIQVAKVRHILDQWPREGQCA